MAPIIRKGTIEEVLIIHQQISELNKPLNKTEITEKLFGNSSLILIAEFDKQLVGFKVGFAINATDFYSWIGGVVPKFRNRGIANKLRQYQEQWAFEQGFTTVNVKSMNQFPAMMQMLIG